MKQDFDMIIIICPRLVIYLQSRSYTQFSLHFKHSSIFFSLPLHNLPFKQSSFQTIFVSNHE